jgi:inorganic pyrophosphatase
MIEVPRGGHRKREWRRELNRSGGRLVTEYLSPVGSPFNYGCILDGLGADGDPPDAVVLGPRCPAGVEVLAVVRGVVRFVDAGLDDPKLICSGTPPSAAERSAVERFFRRYAVARRLLNAVQGHAGNTAYLGADWNDDGREVGHSKDG